MEEWKQKAASSESRANELEAKVSVLNGELERLREEGATKGTGTPCWDAQNEMEKRVLVCRLKEKENHHHRHHGSNENNSKEKVTSDGNRKVADIMSNNGLGIAQKRTPFRDIGNSSLLLGRKQHSKTIFPLLHCSQSLKTSQNL